MKCAAVAAWSAVLLTGVASAAFAAAAGDPTPPRREEAKAALSLEAVFGKTLISIDGSTIQIIASEGRISREIVASNGAVQRTSFVFINARLGTVADSRDAARVTGVFRASDAEILIQFADGSSEIVRPNSDSGITIEMSSPRNPTYCTSWYPEGHVFTLEDRRAALLQYANRLGLGVSTTEKAAGTPAPSGCDSVAPAATAASSTTSAPAASPVPAATPAPAALAPPAAAPAVEMPDAAQKAASLAAPKPGAGTPAVLPSIAEATAAAAQKAADASAAKPADLAVAGTAAATQKAAEALAATPADLPVVATTAAATQKAVEAPAANPADLPVVATTAAAQRAAEAQAAKPADLPAATKVAELPPTNPVEVRKSEVHLIDPPPADVMAAVATMGEAGASSCLNVESDGKNWGFRNKCGYSVQYAYCTMDGRNQLTACKEGFVGGSVAANGFGVLVADENLRSVNENHDFRWVACQGGAGEVIARMDKSDPPAGRCVR